MEAKFRFRVRDCTGRPHDPTIDRRTLGVSAIALLTAPLGPRGARAAAPSEIVIDWATYNPVSLVLKDQRLLETAFAPDSITIRWVQSAGSNKALSSSTPDRWTLARQRRRGSVDQQSERQSAPDNLCLLSAGMDRVGDHAASPIKTWPTSEGQRVAR